MKWNLRNKCSQIALIASFLCVASMNYADVYVREDIITTPLPENFNICHGGTCEYIAHVKLTEVQWQSIKRIFNHNESAKQERNNIKLAIAKMELIVGSLTNTYNDKAENITDEESNHYMDCIDESINTSLYLTMMKEDKLIRFHHIEDRENRGYFFNGWPHTTAVVKEIHTEERYAVDSWFLDNGKQPYVIPIKEWKEGWRP